VASPLKSTIREELLQIQESSPDHILYPRRALEWARKNRRSALYNALDWQDREAAEKWRLQQVRSLITLHITFADGAPQVISLSIDRTSGGGYRSIGDVMKIPDLRKIAIMDALRDLERMRLKYQHLEELAKIWEELDGVKTTPSGPPPSPPGAPPRPRGDGPKRPAGPKRPGPKRPRNIDIRPKRMG
jgi:hypothetical protein